MNDREQWRSRTGFILATIGSAVGIGNIWRFSYVAGENGGGAFLLIYLAFVVLIGLPLVIGELSLGRRAQGDAIAAFTVADPEPRHAWPLAGWMAVVGCTVILSYYAVIAGWALDYAVGAVTGTLWTVAAAGYGGYFQQFVAGTVEPVVWQATMLAATVAVVASGVQGGIERLNRWLMPTLAVIVTGLAIHAVSLPGAGAGLRFLFAPDWSAFADPAVYAAALGQAFFSLGVGAAVFATYGSYLPRTVGLPASAIAIVVGDTLFALVAGLAIFPAVFAFGVDPKAGPELAFITLPQIFLAMPGGRIVGTLFFFLLAAAALTSMLSMLEVPVAVAMRRLRLRRRTAALAAGALVFLLGLPSALGFGLLSGIRIAGRGILDAIDAVAADMVLPLGGLAIALFVGWRIEQGLARREADLYGTWAGTVWLWLLRIPVPLAIGLILVRAATG
ncbi:transporter [Thalassobaculum fulvum]|uniref:Transporter n=1 Tax=Thalassobaculum fulvum TaxID=1633335 RepID=A0A918XUV3_9PROT|nr:sodium-dependent transporter [Thalassobaculum fulvum]GHD56267.1 transporter [Thalassobaculum fulvum]